MSWFALLIVVSPMIAQRVSPKTDVRALIIWSLINSKLICNVNGASGQSPTSQSLLLISKWIRNHTFTITYLLRFEYERYEANFVATPMVSGSGSEVQFKLGTLIEMPCSTLPGDHVNPSFRSSRNWCIHSLTTLLTPLKSLQPLKNYVPKRQKNPLRPSISTVTRKRRS